MSEQAVHSSISNRSLKLIIAGIAAGIVITITILGLAIAIFVKINSSSTSDSSPSAGSLLGDSIRIEELMDHLKEFQRIATANNGNRAVSTLGFNQTLDYIRDTLAINTDFVVSNKYFPIRQFGLNSDPILTSSINGVNKTYIYSKNLATADFYHIDFSTAVDFSAFVPLTAIPNVGCSDSDWQSANPPPNGRVAIVKRGICAFSDKGALAAKYNVTALLIYNDGASPDRVSPIAIALGQESFLPALFLSFPVGQELANAALNISNNAGVRLAINVKELPLSPVGNICADTPTGDANQTIIIGSHSDSVPAGPGINDNGSGSAANLGLAVALARLFKTSTYAKYKYRVRFCWWGAEEVGLLGSDDHVKQAKISTVVGERLSDYLVNLNYDMLGSPNYIFGIYDGKTANSDTPVTALPGSNKMTALYRQWFDEQNLPWNYTDFSGRSDYGPFLAEGIVAGGLFSGADGTKTLDERNYYDQMLGQGMGGIAGAIHDPCYHRQCDSIQNINVFAYEKMVQAAAYVLEQLARQDDLKTWLYPASQIAKLNDRQKQQQQQQRRKPKYNSINEYFGYPYY
ncbi:unnamed protein product [Rotaria magnacalcarata]|uniref:Peptide hydrolase n=2 Tax=Rotaria magnacalcarata TaxID=392030 RepID=A0A816FMY0_9BILA|nr:unnamed protein product [Rotaria magnacalcarata]CAF1663811.1 unnamed protein product [Rotaria magnacalcarata]CAF4011434.1 unnamed protein product [Rotaria magnacalcarata]